MHTTCTRHAYNVFLSDFDCGPAPWLRNIHIFMSARGWFIVSDHWAQWQPRSSLRWEMTCRPWMVEQILALATALPASPLLAATAVRGCVVGPMQLEVRWECGVNMKSHGIPCLSRMYVLSIYCTCFFYIRVLSVLLVGHQSRFGNLVLMMVFGCFLVVLYAWQRGPAIPKGKLALMPGKQEPVWRKCRKSECGKFTVFFWQSLRTHLVWKRWPILAMMDGFNLKNLKAHGPTWFYIIAIFSLQNQECRIIIIRTIFLTLPRFDASSISFKGHGARDPRDPKNPRDPSWGILRANRRLPLLLRSQRFGHHDCIGALRQWVGHGRTVGATAKS